MLLPFMQTRARKRQSERVPPLKLFLWHCQFHRNLFHNLNLKPFERRYSPRVIGQQPDALEIEIGKNLGSQTDFALNFALAVR